MTVTLTKIFSSWFGGAASRSHVDDSAKELPTDGLELKKPLGRLERLTRFAASIKSFFRWEKPERNADTVIKPILFGVREDLNTSTPRLRRAVQRRQLPRCATGWENTVSVVDLAVRQHDKATVEANTGNTWKARHLLAELVGAAAGRDSSPMIFG